MKRKHLADDGGKCIFISEPFKFFFSQQSAEVFIEFRGSI